MKFFKDKQEVSKNLSLQENPSHYLLMVVFLND